MVLKIYGHPLSPYTAPVVMVCHEKQIPFELVLVDLTNNEHKAPTYTQHQPFGQVPYIDDDGFILYESRAIARYLAAKYPQNGEKLIPDSNNIQAVALYDQAVSVETVNFTVLAGRVVFEIMCKQLVTGQPPDPKVFDVSIKQLEEKLKGYEVLLGRQKYLAGDELTLADLFHLPNGKKLAECGSDIMSRQGPNVTRWWNELSLRESWKFVSGDNGVPSRLD
ncbi:glutathione S-transferase [Marasmius fiardii PR-910]|nr:glutathione S-transferase [Marasmius fiardii PR-910]